MEVEKSCTRVRVTFTREFPLDCGNLTSPSPSLKRFVTYVRDFPPGCGPLAAKATPFYPENNLVTRVNSGSKPGPGPTPGSGLDGGAGLSLGKRLNLGSKPRLGPGPSPGLGGGAGLNSGQRENLGSKPRLGLGPGPGLGGGAGLNSGQRENLGSKTFQDSGLGLGGRREAKLKFVEAVGNSNREVTVGKHMEGVSKERVIVLKMLELFRRRCDELSKRGVRRVDIEANRELSREGKLKKQRASKFGDIAGVEVGDKFYYRVELTIVGLHRLPQGGIDSMECGGERYATCIVASEGHLDKMDDPNVLIYGGEGGTLKRNEVGVPPDQQLVAGNRALDNSRVQKNDVRVVRGLRYGAGNAKVMYVYDGLYKVVKTVKKKGTQGNIVFEFLLTRNPGQPVVRWREYRQALA